VSWFDDLLKLPQDKLGLCDIPDDLGEVTLRGPEDRPEEAGLTRDAVEQLWARVEALYRGGAHPAVQVSIRCNDVEVLNRAIGHASGNGPGELEAGIPLRPIGPDTPVNLFSAAKPITAMLVHKLHDEGVLQLDDPIANYIPEFGCRGKEEITLRHVLSHRAGIPAPPEGLLNPDLLGRPEKLVELLCDVEPETRPGEASAYHAITGGLIVGEVVRRASGKTVRELAETNIRRPLGISRLAFGVEPDEVEQVARNSATGPALFGPLQDWVTRVIGTPLGDATDLSNDPRFLTSVVPSANLVTTAHDIGIFYQCMLDGGDYRGTRVFEEKSVRRSRAIESKGQLDRRLLMPVAYSTGFMCGSSGLSLYGWNHPNAFGHIGLSNIFTWADPDRALVVALLTTGKPVLTPHVVPLFQLVSAIHDAFPEVG
jgi:CubicO group peptidase (beta-lactamase class C family)